MYMYVVKIERSYHVPLRLLSTSTSFALLPINVITKNKIYQLLRHLKKKICKSEKKKYSASLTHALTVEFC